MLLLVVLTEFAPEISYGLCLDFPPSSSLHRSMGWIWLGTEAQLARRCLHNIGSLHRYVIHPMSCLFCSELRTVL